MLCSNSRCKIWLRQQVLLQYIHRLEITLPLIPFTQHVHFGYQSTIIKEANARFYKPMPLTLAWPETIPLPTPFPSSTLSAWRKTSRLQTPFLSTSLSASPKTFQLPAPFPSTTLARALAEHEYLSSKSFFQILYLINRRLLSWLLINSSCCPSYSFNNQTAIDDLHWWVLFSFLQQFWFNEVWVSNMCIFFAGDIFRRFYGFEESRLVVRVHINQNEIASRCKASGK